MSISRPQQPAIRTAWVFVTPKVAETYVLLNHPNNRPISKSRVARYTRDMTAGRWIPTHEGIAFDTKGRLVDGQHTLNALLQSQTSQWLNVSKAVPPEALPFINTGGVRSLRDALRISGSTVPLNAATIIAAEPIKGQHPGATKAETLTWASKYRKELVRVVELFSAGTKRKNTRTAVVQSIVFLALLHEDAEKVADFVKVYLGLSSWNEYSKPAVDLANRFADAAGSYYAGQGGKNQATEFITTLYRHLHGKKAAVPTTPWVFRG